MFKRALQIVLALSALLMIGGTGAAIAAPSTSAVQPTPTILCSLRWDDWESDCMRAAGSLTRSHLIPGLSTFNWTFIGTGAPDTYTIHRVGTDFCVDVNYPWVDAGVVLRPCDGTVSQNWIMDMSHSAGPNGLEIFHPLKNDFSDLYLTFETITHPGQDPGATPIVQRPFGDRDSQYFALLGPA